MIAFGLGIASRNSALDIIETFFPQPAVNPGADLARELSALCGLEPGGSGYRTLDAAGLESFHAAARQASALEQEGVAERLRDSDRPVLLCISDSQSPPTSVPEAFLKLHLLSHRLTRPHAQNLDGIFSVLHNLAWTSRGPVSLQDLPGLQLEARKRGESLSVHSVDKFPKMSDYVVPSGVRLADSARIRLGAYIGEGTTVMHEGFVNFNAGTEGQAMIEGRVSAGVMVGENSDLGGSSSTMGTLSGGGTEIVSVGRNCLIGANAGIGMPLADGCIVEAGLYLTAGAVVRELDAEGNLVRTCKALELSGLPHRLFRRNSLSGAIECLPRKAHVALNEELHAHN